MKKALLAGCFALAVFSASAEGKLLKEWDFEGPEGLMVFPAGTTLEFDEEEFHGGAKSLVFTQDNNSCVYFWQKVQAGHKYVARVWYKTEKAPIARCGMTVNFKNAEGKTTAQHRPLAENCTADNLWHEASFEFTAPEDAVNSQVILNFYRCNTLVFLDDFSYRDETEQIEAQKLPDKAISTGKLVKSFDFVNNKGLLRDPKGELVIGKDEKLGKSFLSFTARNNYSAYFYLTTVPEKEYTAEFLYRASGEVIKRCGFTVFFTSKGGKRGDLGQQHVALNTLPDSNGTWRHGSMKFKVPANTASTQYIINFFRCNTKVDIADFKIFEEQ